MLGLLLAACSQSDSAECRRHFAYPARASVEEVEAAGLGTGGPPGDAAAELVIEFNGGGGSMVRLLAAEKRRGLRVAGSPLEVYGYIGSVRMSLPASRITPELILSFCDFEDRFDVNMRAFGIKAYGRYNEFSA